MSPSSTVQQIYAIGELYMLYAGVFNLITGIIGNIFIILLFTTLRVFKGNQSAFYLTAESISNIGLLLALYLSRILTHILGYDPVLNSLSWCKIRSMITHAFGLCSLFNVCFLAFDQYLSTNRRYNWRQMSAFKLSHRLIFFNNCFAIVHSTTFFIFTEIQSSMGCAVYNSIIKRYYSLVYFPIISSTLPLIITITSSLLAYRNVRRIVRRQVPVIRRRLDRQMTAMTLARVMVFVICGVPFICISLYELNISNNENNDMKSAIVNLLSSILYSLLYTNFAVNKKNLYLLLRLFIILDQFLYLLDGIITFSSSNKKWFNKKMLAFNQMSM
jgi:hypothetical protein